MAEPKQKSIEVPAYLPRILPQWQSPQWMQAERWRLAVRNQPVAIVCRDNIIANVLATPWQIRAKDTNAQDEYLPDIEYYTERVLNDDLQDFDTKMEETLQDTLDLPIGGNVETIRWSAGTGPPGLAPWDKGHVYRIVHVDGATLYPTHDKEWPMAQRVRGELGQTIFFSPDEMGRIIMNSRPELARSGYGMAPPEKAYLALILLLRGDTYYANLLLDTPEAGILDLMDMEKQAASEWIKTYTSLLQGIDPQKIGILYEHEKAANYISFGRPPTDLMFAETTTKYARILAASYGLTLSDIGMEPGGAKTLAGEIRGERKARRSGYGLVKEKVRNFFNRRVLPPYLEFVWVEADEEALILRYRAFSLGAVTMRNLVEPGILQTQDAIEQLTKDGLITVEVEEPPEPEPVPAVFAKKPEELEDDEKKEASEGGRGELTGRAETEDGDKKPLEAGDERVSAVPPYSEIFGQMESVVSGAFRQIVNGAGDAQLLRLVKAATRGLFPTAEKAFIALTEEGEIPIWLGQRLAMWFGEESAFDGLESPVRKADQETLDELERLLDEEDWWKLPAGTEAAILWVLTQAYAQGASVAAEMAWRALYTEGLVSSPNIIGLNFTLTNPRTLAQLESYAARLVTRVNDGTKYYLKRIITSGVEEGLASPKIAEMIRDGEEVSAILKEGGYAEGVIGQSKNELSHMSEYRTKSIVNTEVAAAETRGRVGQWDKMGLTKKRWIHTGATAGKECPCPVCQSNIDLDFVAMDYMYESVFGPSSIPGPPAHPSVCHCHIEFNEEELMSKAGDLEVWTGE